MSRVAIAVAGLWVALLQQPAATHARNVSAPEAFAPAMCDDASQPFVLASNAAGFERTPALHASRASELQPQAAGALPTENEDPPAWCLTPNDPRCSPRDTSTPLQGQLLLLPLCDFAVVKLPEPRSSAMASTPPCPELGTALAGIHGRVERPPRD